MLKKLNVLNTNVVNEGIVAKWKKHQQLLKTQTTRPLLDILLFCLNQRNPHVCSR